MKIKELKAVSSYFLSTLPKNNFTNGELYKNKKQIIHLNNLPFLCFSGSGGIRTPGTVARTSV